MHEQWREIIGYPDYEVSNLGSVRSWRIKGTGGGRRETPLILKGGDVKGYLHVTLYRNGERKNKLVHKLVLVAFRGEQPAGMEACHYNGDPVDNRLSNLRWDTHVRNMADSVRDGTRARLRGTKNGASKLTEEQVLEIRADNKPQRAIAKFYGISQRQVSIIKRRESWAWLSG